ncbi:MAG TPA: hypothetical protein GXZ91_08245 [Christensenellaceae bacterium]|nr:hypothetical protein [Christensenellaceae bacterium]
MTKPIYQNKMLEFIKQFPNNGKVMIPIFGKTDVFGTDAFFQCILFPIEKVAEEMGNDNTNQWNTMFPGFTYCVNGHDIDITYTRFNNEYNKEPFVIIRDFYGLGKPSEIEIVEEFRLINNLYFDREKNEYVDLTNNTVVVKIENDFVTVHRKYLIRYLAVKEMAMLIHISSHYYLDIHDPDINAENYTEKTDNKIYSVFFDKAGIAKEVFSSHIYAKFAIHGCPIKDCGYWPYDENNREYEDFIIGVNDDGDDLTFTSDPSKLADYYGKNPNAPHYLTPVFFRREVLQKYYNNPDRYSIESDMIRCGALWSLQIDNERSDYVSAYLGDLGRDLPDNDEQKYWKTYNIAIDGKLSESKFIRDFLGVFSPSESPIFTFQHKYKEINETFENKLGFPLFLPLHDNDKYALSGLRIPLLESQPEFDSQVLALTKLLIDSLNEKKLKEGLQLSEEIRRSISILEKYFQTKGLTDYTDVVKFLRNLQELRSASIAHRKGKNYEKIAKVFGIGDTSYSNAFEIIMNEANAFLDYLDTNIDKLAITK